MDTLIDAKTAAERLGVKLPTLYAYVSRGLLHSHQRPGVRGSLFEPEEVAALALRGRAAERTGRHGGASPELHGASVRIESAITFIDGERVFVRGRDLASLSSSCSFEQVAELLWTGELPAEPVQWWPEVPAVRAARSAGRVLADAVLPLEHLRLAVVAIGASDPLRFELAPTAVVVAARRLLSALPAALPARGTVGSRVLAPSIASALWPRLSIRPPHGARLEAVNSALVLLADHELAGSTLAARVAASFRADPYAVVSAGLAVFSGALHGGASVGVEDLIDEVVAAGDAATVVGERLRRGERVPGLGHPLYRRGDPRFAPLAASLARAVDAGGGADDVIDALDDLTDVVSRRGLPPPNIDLALGALARGLGLVRGAGEVLGAVSRTAGWLAHAMEEYASRTSLRLRADYRGPLPSDA